MPFEEIALFDNHAHPWLRAPDAPFACYFSEAPFSQPDTLFYRSAVRELSEWLGCAVDDLQHVRDSPDYARRLVSAANVSDVLLDDGYPREGAYTVAECGAMGGFRAHRVLRLERLAEDLLERCDSLAQLESSLLAELSAARPTIVALKSIVAYRSGLMIEAPDRAAAASGVKPGRLTHKPLLDYLFQVAARFAAETALPLHVHTGFGDRDLDLRLANPLHLRPFLENGLIGTATPLVLLHTSYPYVREAAYLASVYPNVFVDLSEASPLLAGPALTHVLSELLALAPVTRLLYGSDAWGIPDWLWLAARATRRALCEALAWLPADEAHWAARRVLCDNAAALYQ
jgi:hypothetical protein